MLDTGENSSFAPALTAIEGKLVIAWMVGDDGRRGRVRRGVLNAETLQLKERVDASQDGGNHRDPEIAAAGRRIYLVWSDFTRDREGVPVMQTLVCP